MTAPTAETVEAPMTARAFLLGDDSVAALSARMREARALDGSAADWSTLGRAAAGMAEDQVAAVAAGFLDVDLGHVVVAGWRKHRQLLAAARDTAAAPGSVVVVPLAGHTIEAAWRPRIEAVVGTAPVAHVELPLTVAFTFTAVVAGVAGGRLTQLGGGPGRVSVQFSLGGQVLVERGAGYDTRLAIPLGAGIPLLDGRHERGSVASGRAAAG